MRASHASACHVYPICLAHIGGLIHLYLKPYLCCPFFFFSNSVKGWSRDQAICQATVCLALVLVPLLHDPKLHLPNLLISSTISTYLAPSGNTGRAANGLPNAVIWSMVFWSGAPALHREI